VTSSQGLAQCTVAALLGSVRWMRQILDASDLGCVRSSDASDLGASDLGASDLGASDLGASDRQMDCLEGGGLLHLEVVWQVKGPGG